jgi:hypothetical protein
MASVPKDAKQGLPGAPFYLENNFFELASALRAQFEEQISTAIDRNSGMTPLVYAYSHDNFQFLTAGSDRLFAPDILENLINKLRSWGIATAGAQSVSTPQVRVYIHGCRRYLLRDGVGAPWHYMLSLTQGHHGEALCVKMLREGTQKGTDSREIGLNRTLSLQLDFNQLFVHDTNNAYSIEPGRPSMDPHSSAIFLDGYLW